MRLLCCFAPQAHAEVAKLLCKALRALLLVMLGRGDKAMTLLQTIPALVRESEGGNPDAMRALPLSWDALLIAGALTFLLGQLSTYRRIRASVMACVESMPWEVCFFFLSSRCEPEHRFVHISDRFGGEQPFLRLLVLQYEFSLHVPMGIYPP